VNGMPKCLARHVTTSPSLIDPDEVPPTIRSPDLLIDSV